MNIVYSGYFEWLLVVAPVDCAIPICHLPAKKASSLVRTLCWDHQNAKAIEMVCEKCEKKLGKVITPDPWKAGARNTTEGGGRLVNENKALTAKKARFTPYGKFAECRICRQKVHQVGSNYCQGCAYKKGICAMCGKKILETKNYRQTST